MTKSVCCVLVSGVWAESKEEGNGGKRPFHEGRNGGQGVPTQFVSGSSVFPTPKVT